MPHARQCEHSAKVPDNYENWGTCYRLGWAVAQVYFVLFGPAKWLILADYPGDKFLDSDCYGVVRFARHMPKGNSLWISLLLRRAEVDG